MLPEVDDLRAGHSVASLAALAEALSTPAAYGAVAGGEKARLIRGLTPRQV